MPITRFPDPRDAGPEGIVALGGDLHPQSLILAYRQGIFPWPMEGYPLIWASPAERGILEFNDLRIPRSLAKERARTTFRFSIDEAGPKVIRACSSIQRPGQEWTWITPRMIEAYIHFHTLGYAHSVEVWDGEELVGGLYGVAIHGVFAGESMFHRRSNASKLALLHLIDHLKERGADWIDIQTITPHFEALGARTIPRDEFLQKLAATQELGLRLFDTNDR